jgi:hypothetical protein
MYTGEKGAKAQDCVAYPISVRFDDSSKRKAFVWPDVDWISLGGMSLSIGMREWVRNETTSRARALYLYNIYT